MFKKILLILTILSLLLHGVSAGNELFKRDSTKAVELFFKGIDLARNSFYQEAIDTFKISLKIREKLYGEKTYETGVVHNAIGINYKNIGNLHLANEYFLEAELSFSSEYSRNEMAIARIYNNIGNVQKSNMNYGAALDYFHRAINIFSKYEENYENIADIYYNIADINYKQNNYDKVLEITDRYFPQAYPDTRLFFLSLKAASLKELNKLEDAYYAYKEAIAYANVYYSETDPNLILEYLNFINFLIAINDFKEAEQVLNFVENIFIQREFKEGFVLSFYYNTKGAYYESLVVESKEINTFREQKILNLKKAIIHYIHGLKALRMDTDNFSSASELIENSISLSHGINLLNSIADTYSLISDIYPDIRHRQKTESIHKSLEYYRIASDLIQQARKEIHSDESKIMLGELAETTFFNIVQTSHKAYSLAPSREIMDFAFTSAERMKASSVFDRLSDQFAKENSLIPDSLTEMERSLNYNITRQNEKLFNLSRTENADSAAIYKTDSLLFHLKKQRDELNQYLEAKYRDYYKLKYADISLQIADVQKQLNSNEVVIEYVINETDTVPGLYAFFISKERAEFYKLDTDSAFLPSLEETFRFVSNPGFLFTRNDHSIAYCIASHNLYRVLIQPFSELIQNKKVTIIPDGKLSYLPFDALLTALPDTSSMVQFANLSYLIRYHTINYGYSTNLLFNFPRQKRSAKNRIMAFAPDYKSDTVVFDNEKLVLIPLPGIQRELDLISKEIKTRLFRGDDASELNFRKYSKDHDILHLAMHAFINDSLPAFSRLAFAQNHETDDNNDGWLNTADIYNLSLNARLTVLSACNTGSGNLKKGEGVMSLARGFLYAGCPSIIMTLWEVEDNAGTEIMQSFYQSLKKGRKTDEALRTAKLKYLENANPRTAHPHYWLGYVSIGSPEPLFRSYDYYFFGLLVLSIGLIITDQVLRIQKNRKKRYKK
jgi:CHAT domain-containing protein/tetratricopeptide (TPR) repeat protein